MKQMEVTILGQSYLLGCPDGGEAALTQAVGQVDREMSAIRDAGKIKARERIAVLAALNLAYQLTAPAQKPSADLSLQSNNLPELDGLIRRLAEALGHDGQLL